MKSCTEESRSLDSSKVNRAYLELYVLLFRAFRAWGLGLEVLGLGIWDCTRLLLKDIVKSKGIGSRTCQLHTQ